MILLYSVMLEIAKQGGSQAKEFYRSRGGVGAIGEEDFSVFFNFNKQQ